MNNLMRFAEAMARVPTESGLRKDDCYWATDCHHSTGRKAMQGRVVLYSQTLSHLADFQKIHVFKSTI
jgi:hypothetical protein